MIRPRGIWSTLGLIIAIALKFGWGFYNGYNAAKIAKQNNAYISGQPNTNKMTKYERDVARVNAEYNDYQRSTRGYYRQNTGYHVQNISNSANAKFEEIARQLR